GVGLFRQPKSKIFVLQATMRCLRAIGETQQTGLVFLSEDNRQILEDELAQNFRCSISEMEGSGSNGEVITVHVRTQKKIKLKRVRHQYTIKEKTITPGIDLELAQALTPENLEQYQLTRISQSGLNFKDPINTKKKIEDVTQVREKREFSELTLAAEIARYLNKPCLWLQPILSMTTDGLRAILDAVNTHNELLYDWIIPRLFKEFYAIEDYKRNEEYEVELIKLNQDGYRITSKPDRTVKYNDKRVTDYLEKSFHLDTYCFDSLPEQQYFWRLLKNQKIKEVYFTGMLTHGQSEFFIQYIDPDSHTIRSYYPDFLYQKEDGTYVIVEVKADFMINDPTIQAKKEFAQQMAIASGMTYTMVPSSQAKNVEIT
ncbi:MAG: type III restriction endonuclease, partial [Synechococcaceae cyanobacterium RL_1_2]|nr:type III restriction endonuclease [Synechococcaceae cyanobacterium RL_1_2]